METGEKGANRWHEEERGQRGGAMAAHGEVMGATGGEEEGNNRSKKNMARYK